MVWCELQLSYSISDTCQGSERSVILIGQGVDLRWGWRARMKVEPFFGGKKYKKRGVYLLPLNVTFECSIRYHQWGNLHDSRTLESPPNAVQCILEDPVNDPLRSGGSW